MNAKQRLIRFFTLSVVGLLIGGAIAGGSLFFQKDEQATPSRIVASSIGGPFTLVDQNGKTVTDKDYAGKDKLVYFGFASCPAICPGELQKMADAYNQLPKDMQAKIQPIFITVDPERDTPDILKDYVDMFLPNMVGLSGTQEQVDGAKSAFKVYAAKVPEGDSYTMDHSSFIYYQLKSGGVASLFRTTDKVDEMVRIINQIQVERVD
jgi:protein SCO1/2